MTGKGAGSPELQTAAAAVEAALNRLDKGIRQARQQRDELAALSQEAERLRADRTRLAAALDTANAKAERLDKTAGDVSRRLVGAMEKVRLALDTEERG